MLSIRDISLLRKSETSTSVEPEPDFGPTSTLWSNQQVFFSPIAVPRPVIQTIGSLSLTIAKADGLDYEILRPIPVVIERDEDYFIASFNETNIHASGDTMERALTNLKTYIGDVFDEVSAIGSENLGPTLRYEFALLQTYIQKRNAE